MGALTDSDKLKAKERVFEKLGISNKSVTLDVDLLKDWMAKHPYFPNVDHLNLDTWLENQIIMAKNSLEKTKGNIEKYFCIRGMCPELFENRDVMESSLSLSYETLTISYLPGVTDRLHKVCMVRIEDQPVENFQFEPIIKRCLLAIEYYLKEGIYFTGFHLVFDLQHLKLNHLGAFKLSLMRYMSLSMKAFPFSMAVTGLMNCPPFIEKAISLFKPFISSKLYSRIVIIKDIDALKEVIGDVKLPSDYCSDNSISQKEYSDAMKLNFHRIKDYILCCDKVKCDKNFNDLKSTSAESEMFGTFRALTLD
ncbi:uncharacterized protein LOC106663953 [Cimex lectularius]|uniref:CRAL-TRIO domain-containing protein n=1 Tax=Cimex lectularius TaxID=79782 RepID=A0A8I6TM67_CIMLE|nr:uncharacterized protein LOC106663953 [Cimex lectularius]XP_024082624.1 uncharacterized protein LOC106663953 [Cimex lectularius]